MKIIKRNQKYKEGIKNMKNKYFKLIMPIATLLLPMSIMMTGCGETMNAVEPADEEIIVAEEINYEYVSEIEEVEAKDVLGLLPQTVKKKVDYRVNPNTGEREIVSQKCDTWKVKNQKLGGTCWKKSTPEGDIYIRLRDTIEFFHTSEQSVDSDVTKVEYATTILGALYVDSDEVEFKRIHIMSGTITVDGEMTICGVRVEDNSEIEFNLNEFEKITKEDLPFTEEEFREISDQLG